MTLGFDSTDNPKDVRHNRLHDVDRAFHDWYRFILSFPPHLVRRYFDQFQLADDAVILDPFCGTGTTLVEAKKYRLNAVGIEATPMSHLASRVKTTWDLDCDRIYTLATEICDRAICQHQIIAVQRTFDANQFAVILKDSICEKPLHKCLILRDEIEQVTTPNIRHFFQLALAYTAVYDASNLRFAPEVGIRRRQRQDADVFEAWYDKVQQMIEDLRFVQSSNYPQTRCHRGDAREASRLLEPNSIDAVITSPPYPNEKDYTRTTRLESVLLGFLKNKDDLRFFKKSMMRSNSRNIYVADQDDSYLSPTSSVIQLAQAIEQRRLDTHNTSGFARLYPRATLLYFGGMKRHLAELRTALRPGAKLAYVVGDQASYLQVLIQTGTLLAEIAEELNYTVCDIELFRTRLSSKTGEQLKEEVLILEWNP